MSPVYNGDFTRDSTFEYLSSLPQFDDPNEGDATANYDV